MTGSLADLQAPFRARVQAALGDLAGQGSIFVPYFTLRDPVVQARLWRQSRAPAVIGARIAALRAQHCPFIAACLDHAGPADGPWATNALPGLSWHQYGAAVDCYLQDGAGPHWADDRHQYELYGRTGERHGLYWGGHFHDIDHWQNGAAEPLAVFGSMTQIDTHLARDWPDLIPGYSVGT